MPLLYELNEPNEIAYPFLLDRYPVNYFTCKFYLTQAKYHIRYEIVNRNITQHRRSAVFWRSESPISQTYRILAEPMKKGPIPNWYRPRIEMNLLYRPRNFNCQSLLKVLALPDDTDEYHQCKSYLSHRLPDSSCYQDQ